MANGQQLAERNYVRFVNWMNEKAEADFKQYVHGGQLKRRKIARECEFAESVLRSNPRIKAALANLENNLRKSNILPPAVHGTGSLGTDQLASGIPIEYKRLKKMEEENTSQKAEIMKLKDYIERYKLIEEYMSETLRMPR